MLKANRGKLDPRQWLTIPSSNFSSMASVSGQMPSSSSSSSSSSMNAGTTKSVEALGNAAVTSYAGGSDAVKAVPFSVTFISGGLSGTLGALVTNPLEVVKTRMQSSVFRASTTRQLAAVQTSSNIWGHVVGTCSMLKDIYRLEGVAALWRGTTATLVGVIPSRAIYFSSYQWAKGALAQAYNAGEQNSWRVHLPAALFAGVAVNTATNPIWLVKTKMQLQSSLTVGAMQYQSVGECVRHVFAVDGVKGFYRGLTASYLGAVEGAVHWVTYEQFKNMFASHRSKHGGGDLHWGDYFASAALSKLLAAVVAYPHEVLRTRLREDGAKYRGLSRTFALVLKEEGAGAFYGGLTAHLMRTVPNSAIMFFTYECLMAAYRHFHQ